MNPADKGRITRDRMRGALKAYVSVQNKGAAGLNATKVSADDYFQQSPLSGGFFKSLYGNEDDFFARYDSFVNDYFAALDDKAKHAKGVSINADLMKRRGTIDLGVLNRQASDELYERYVRDVLQLDKLIGRGGLPGVEMPSANLYSKSFRYMTEPDANGAMHPAQVILNRSFFNFNPRKQGLDSLKISRRNILSGRALREVASQAKSGDIFAGIQDGMKVLTLDVETTGIFDFSHVRSFSAVESTFAGGKLSIPTAVANMLFDSPQLNGVTVGSMNGGTISLNKFLAMNEGAGIGSKAMDDFLEEGAKFAERLVQADRVAGHNVFFDLDKFTQTMQSMSGFEGHTRAKAAMKTLWDRIDEGNFIVDTLESTRLYLNNQVNELVKTSNATDLAGKSKAYVDNLFSQEILARVHVGGSAAPFSMENIALNTNLFELIERDKQAGSVFDLITRGSHVAETDVHLQTYMANYVQSGELKIWPLAGEKQSEFGRFARSKILKSQAVTPTTNIADIGSLSDNVYNYVTQTDKARGISMNIANVGDVFGQKLMSADGTSIDTGGMSGTLKYMDNEFRLLTKEGVLSVDQSQAQAFISGTLAEARGPARDVINVGNRTYRFNRSALAINDFGVSYATASRADQMFGISTTAAANTFDDSALVNAFGSVYRNYGSGLSMRDQAMGAFGASPRDSVFQLGLGNFASGVPGDVAQKFAAIGDPLYFMDAESRSISTMIAESTARTGTIANKLARDTVVDTASIAFSSNTNLTAELGVSYFKAQEEMSAFRAASREFGTSKIVVPTELIKQTYDGFADDTIRGLQLSVMDSEMMGTRVNLVWDVRQQMSRDQVRTMFENMYDTLTDDQKVAKTFGVGIDDLNKSVKSEVAFARTTLGKSKKARAQAIDLATDTAMERGIVLGFADGDEAGSIIGGLRRMGLDISNDTNIRNFMADMLRTQLGKETIAVSAFTDRQAVKIAGRDKALRAATEVVTDASGNKISRAVQSYNQISERIGADKQLGRQIKKGVKYGKLDDGGRVLADFYTSHKPKLGLGLAISALAGVGYYQAKKKREKDLYEESMNKMPYQSGRPLDTMAETYSFPPDRMNPLETAGVVGSLDRNKIGHHQMGTNKYDHLFGR